MTAERQRRYRFATGTQWSACLVAQVDGTVLRTQDSVQPLAPYGRPGSLFESAGAYLPVVTHAGEILWCDGAGRLHRLDPCGGAPDVCPAPWAIADAGARPAARAIATTAGVWTMGASPATLRLYDERTLTRFLSVDVEGLVDIATDGRDVLAVVQRNNTCQVCRVDRAGRIGKSIVLAGIPPAIRAVFLPGSRRFVVLAGVRQPQLYWFQETGGAPLFSIGVAALHPCFASTMLGTDLRGKIFLAGRDGQDFGGGSWVLVLDEDSNLLDTVPIDSRDAPVSGVAADRDSLLVTGPRGLVRFMPAAVVPDGAGEVSCTVVTPMLMSPDRPDGRRWLRVEASANLPDGCTLEVLVAGVETAEDRARLTAMAADLSVPASRRVTNLLAEPALWRGRTQFQGGDAVAHGQASAFSAPLFDIREPYLLVAVRLTAAAGAQLPALTELDVLYAGPTLMEHLPAIYQREEARPDSFLRALVGVLEATTQDLDGRIGSMGSRIHPSTAPEDWLNFVARWIGVPWDDGLSVSQKRAIVQHAPALIKGRGTRAGLEALLEALMPGTPRRFRVSDPTADYGFAIVGGGTCVGSSLPAMLGGRTRWTNELDSRAVLDYMRLPCAGQLDDGVWQLAGKIRIDIAATAAERNAWEPWLASVIGDMVPVTTRVALHFVSPQALRTGRLDGSMSLDLPPLAHLGTDAVTDAARLPGDGRRVSTDGPSLSTRLG